MMDDKEPALLSPELMLMSNVVSEVLWVVRHQQKDTAHCFDPNVKIWLSKSKQENSRSSYTLKEYFSYGIAQNMTIENFLKGPIEQLKKLLNKTQGRSECILRIGSQQYNLIMRADIITINLVQQVTSSVSEVHGSYFEFHLKILISKSFEREHKAMEKKVEQNLQRYKMTNPEIVISFQSALASCERLITFPFDASNRIIKLGGLVISVEPRIYVSEAHVQSSRVTHVHIGQPIKLSNTTCDPSLLPVSYCQVGCVTISCGLPGGGAGREQVDKNSNIIKISFSHFRFLLVLGFVTECQKVTWVYYFKTLAKFFSSIDILR
ncbi:hypothetical protein HOLleu_08349 [Holothuria leucospilota]|uniref:Uncharacterized protein n=1 Tax=Holothuria leucospilota TaxID=206669 RepID=A0A9Q1CIJ3_HOLLE|nr:hypothetical protein HOLleu_08349 [Holothuria leucospilota]